MNRRTGGERRHKAYHGRSRRALRNHVGTFVQGELEARGWTARTLACAAGLSLAEVRAILAGSILTTIAAGKLAEAFGSDPELWLTIDAEHRARELARSQF
jgi:plasmid maintenance system antidote protein VapI